MSAGKWTGIAAVVTALGTAIPALVTSLGTNADLRDTVATLETTLDLAQRAVAENKALIRDLDRSFAVLEGRLRGFEIADRLLFAAAGGQ